LGRQVCCQPAKDPIFERSFSLLGIGEGEDSPLLLREGQGVFKFYASGRRYLSRAVGDNGVEEQGGFAVEDIL
jgi:hypothetical protein